VAATSSRTLRLLSLLQAQSSWSGPQLADRLGVSARTLRRDVDRLRELGYPVDATRGAGGGYRMAPGASLPPLALDDEEAVALVLGLQSAVAGAPAVAEAALRALTKTVRVLPPRLRRQVDALRAATAHPARTGGSDPDPAVLLALAHAVHRGERLDFDYTAADGRAGRRSVEPHRLVPLWGHWYLLAHDLDRADWRIFRVDRVRGPGPGGPRFRPREPPEPDVAAYVRHRIGTAPFGFAVSAVLHCTAEEARRRVSGWVRVEELPGDRCRLSCATDALEWAAFELARAGCEVSEVRPPELVLVLRDWARRLDGAAPR
jgi:predicted DNA-binding transcriptional regulator YafY